MKILYTIGCYWPSIGGAQLHTRELVKHITEHHQAVVACLRNDIYRDEWLYGWTVNPQRKQKQYIDNSAEVRVLRLGFLTRLALRKKLADYYSDEECQTSCKKMLAGLFCKELAKINRSFDIVHNIMVGEEFFSLASLAFAQKNRIPFIFTPVSHPDGWKGDFFSYLYRNADALIAMTEAEKAFLVSQGAKASKISVVGVGPLLKHLSPMEDIKSKLSINGPIVLFLGQKIQYKGIKQMLEAAPLVWEKQPKAHFIFAGPRTKYSKGLFADQLDARITELGTIDDDKKVNLLSACDVFCMPSVCESFGMVYLEAWKFRKPIIAADTATSRCFIQHGHDGLLVKQEPQSLANAICALLEDPELRGQLGGNGYEKVNSHYTWPKISSAVEKAYQNALDNFGNEPSQQAL